MSNSLNPRKYLGLPTILGRSKTEALAYVKSRIQQKIQSWKINSLSQAGNWMLSSRTSGGVKKRMKVGSIGRVGKPFASQKQLEPESFWAKVLKGGYFSNVDALSATNGSRASWAWSSLLEGQAIIIQSARWQIGNGDVVSIWKDKWIIDVDDGLLHPTSLVPESTPLLVKDIIHPVSRTWDTSQINRFLPPKDIRSIVVTCIGDGNDPNRLIWPHTRNGDYSVKSVPSPEYTAEKASRVATEFIKSGLGVVFRSANGAILNGVSTPCLSSSALQTEAKATFLAVRSERDNYFRDMVFESDSLELIRSFKSDFKKANWTIFPLLIQIRNLSSQFHSISWRWVPRQANSAADWVASHCKRRMCSDVWVIRAPSSLVHILSKDGFPCPP
ncbi:hypothetical protein ACFX11_002977 [Malus domestica]